MARGIAAWLALGVGLALLGAASGAIFAVDLGTEYLKISIVKPGRIPIQVTRPCRLPKH